MKSVIIVSIVIVILLIFSPFIAGKYNDFKIVQSFNSDFSSYMTDFEGTAKEYNDGTETGNYQATLELIER